MHSRITSTSTVASASLAPTQRFPFLDLKKQFDSIRGEVKSAVDRVLESQHFILGPEVTAFEAELKPVTGCEYVLGCASGSDALLLALMALNVAAGDEVIAPPFTFVATVGAIARLGARPVFVDIDPVTYNLDPAQLEKHITPRTRAIIPVHLFGLAADMDPIMQIASKHGIPVVEDAAQAIGAKYKNRPIGSIGTVGCFSFFPSKNLGGAGDGGLMGTNDPELAACLKVLRTHGSRNKYEYDVIGMNSRLDALQAAILRVKLRHLDRWTEGRRKNADSYRSLAREKGLDQIVRLPAVPAGYEHVYNQFTIRVESRDALKEHLRQQGIPTEIYYPYPLHLQAAFAYLGYKPGDCPNAELACTHVLSLPIYAELTHDQLQSVMDGVASFYAA